MKTFLKIFCLIVISQFFMIAFASADNYCLCAGNSSPDSRGKDACCTSKPSDGCIWSKPNDPCPPTPATGGNTVDLPNPLPGVTSVPLLIGNIVKTALGIVGSLALVMFIYGGFVWMLAAGNEQAVEKGKNVLVWAAVGLVVIFASYSLVNFVINAITKGGAQ
jgi:hypothetical protein